MNHTAGKWVYNKGRQAIESTTEWLVEPNKEEDEDGIPTQVISVLGAMGGNNPSANIELICMAPSMFDAISEVLDRMDSNDKPTMEWMRTRLMESRSTTTIW